MKKYLTLAAVTAILGVTWAVAAPPAADKAQAAPAHEHGISPGRMQGMHAMGGMKGMQGMMGQHHGSKHDHEMMACDTSAHGAGKHQHEAPVK